MFRQPRVSRRSFTIARAAAFTALVTGFGIVACSDEQPVNPVQCPTGDAGTGNTSGTKGGGGTPSKAGSGSTPQAGADEGGSSAGGAADGGDGGAAPTSGNGGNGGHGGTAGMSGGGSGGTAGASGTAGTGGGGTSGAGGTGAGTGGAGNGGGGTGGAGTGGGGTGGGGKGGSASLTCGNGTIEAGEECEPINTKNCSNDCQDVATTTCTDCEATANCAPFATACLNSAGTTTPADQALCFDVEECILDSNCADGANAFTACFCGDLNTQDCSSAPDTGATAPKGLCHDQIKAGMGQTAVAGKTGPATNSEVLARLTTRAYAAGAGINRFNCLKNNPACKTACGF